MPRLDTTYMGIHLSNPLIVGSSGLTRTADQVKACEDAGAGAAVLKSLFEEEIRRDYSGSTRAFMAGLHPEADEYLRQDLASHYGPSAYLDVIEQCARRVSIPVIASINCQNPSTWEIFARQLESAGAQAIELNVFILPTDPTRESGEYEKTYVDAVVNVKKNCTIPVSVKLVPYLTNTTRMALELDRAGATGLVLFNRFFHPDIDVEKMTLKGGVSFSGPDEYKSTLRWIGLLSGRIRSDLCAGTGIHTWEEAVKMLLAGASTFQITSTIYLNSLKQIDNILGGVAQWMERHGFGSVDEFRGRLSRHRMDRPELFERAQYIKAFVGAD